MASTKWIKTVRLLMEERRRDRLAGVELLPWREDWIGLAVQNARVDAELELLLEWIGAGKDRKGRLV